MLELGGRPEARLRAFGLERARRDAVHTDPVTGPLDRERARHREHPRLGACAVDGPGSPGPGIGGQDVENGSAASAFDHAPPRGARAEEAAVQDDVDDVAESLLGEPLRRTHEVAGGVVDQGVEPPEPIERRPDHRPNLAVVANIGRDGQGLDAARPDLGRAGGQMVRIAARDHDSRAERGRAPRDLEAEPGPSAGDEDDASIEAAFGKHPVVGHVAGLYGRIGRGARPVSTGPGRGPAPRLGRTERGGRA